MSVVEGGGPRLSLLGAPFLLSSLPFKWQNIRACCNPGSSPTEGSRGSSFGPPARTGPRATALLAPLDGPGMIWQVRFPIQFFTILGQSDLGGRSRPMNSVQRSLLLHPLLLVTAKIKMANRYISYHCRQFLFSGDYFSLMSVYFLQ